MTSDGCDGLPRKSSPLRDEEIERLLTRFFQQEMPAALRDRAPVLAMATVPVVRGPQRSWRQSATAAGVAAALFAATWGVSAPDTRTETSGEGTSITRRAGTTEARVRSHAAPGSLVERFEMDPEHGPVERRIEERTTNVMSEDPEAGPRLESDFPELTIEIVPIQKRPAKPDGSAGSRIGK